MIASLCGIRWGHINAGFVSPTDNPIVKLAFEGAKKLIGKKGSNKKEPFTVEIIKKLVEIFGDSQNLIELRFLVLCILGFSGFFRISELLDIQVRNITQRSNYIEILVSKSKTDQLREGHIVYISQTDTSTCPSMWLKKYLNVTGLKEDPDAYLICRLPKTKRGHNVLGKYSISYSTARKTFIDHLNAIEAKPKTKFGLHSLRSGGASAAANSGVSDRLIGKHGRWS